MKTSGSLLELTKEVRLLTIALGFAAPALPAWCDESVSLAWNASTSVDVTGYVVHYGNASGQYTRSLDVGNVTTATIHGLLGHATYFFVVTAYNSVGLSSVPSNEVSYQVPVPVPDIGSGAFVESDGLVVMEAEHYQSSTSVLGHSWVPTNSLAGYVGDSAMLAAPNTGANISANITNTSPGLTYPVQFTRAGTYKFWIRGWAGGGSDDSVYLGIDGLVARILPYTQTGVWTWSGATINVARPGLHQINLWIREDGAYVDRLLVTTNMAFLPTGDGPPESAQSSPPTNSPPVVQITAPAQGAAFSSSTTVSVSADASDPDGMVATVEFYVNGVLTATATSSPYEMNWSPAPGRYELVAVATDNLGSSATSALVNVTITPPQSAPVLLAQTNQIIAEGTLLVVTNTATDPETPASRLSYGLQSGPANALISAEGVITWTPTEAQGPSVNVFTTVVTDDGSPPLSATNSFVVIVTEANSVPMLPAQNDVALGASSTLLVTNTATDVDVPAQLLTYTLASAPSNAVISVEGIILWTPGAGQAPSTNVFTTVVTDDGSPPLSATNRFMVFVLEPQPIVLQIQAGDHNSLVLSWSSPSSDWVLQESATLMAPDWVDSTNSIQMLAGEQYQVVLPTPSRSTFFRLIRP